MQQDYQMFKIVVIGSMGTGKTNLSTRYIRNEYNEGAKSTVGVQFLSKIVKVRNQNIKVTLWDTAGQQRYKSLSKVYYKGASGILIVYDVTEPQSYLDVQSWMRLANENLNLNQVVLMLVGNKVDIQERRKVQTTRPITQYKDRFDIDCWEVSAKTGYNVKEVFSQLVQKIYQMNMKMRGSQVPIEYDDQSYYGSVADGSVVVHEVAPKGTKKDTKNQTKPIDSLPAIDQVQQVRRSKVYSPQQPKNKNANPANQFSPQVNKIPPKKDDKVKLGKNDKKKNDKQKKKGGCC